MNIEYSTENGKSINVCYKNKEYMLIPSETIDIAQCEQGDVISIYNYKKRNKVNIWSSILLFIERMIIGIFRIIILLYHEEWTEELDPFTIQAEYKIEEQMNRLVYVPAVVSWKSRTVNKPKLMVNGKEINAKIEFDSNYLEWAYIKYCFDIVVAGIYGIAPVVLVIAFSGKFKELFIIPGIMILVVMILIIWKSKEIYNQKCELKEYIIDIKDFIGKI